jgi:hypothetical protein
VAARKREDDELNRTQLLGGAATTPPQRETPRAAAGKFASTDPMLLQVRPRTTIPPAPRPPGGSIGAGAMHMPRPGAMPSEFPGSGVPDASGGIEVMVIRHAAAPDSNVRWRAFELWTKHRVYGMDSALECRQVLDRRTGALEATNPVLGLKLGGGKLRVGNESRYTYPFPSIGMDGIFSNAKRTIRTSRVERFLIRIRDLSTQVDDDTQLTWEAIEGGR